MVPVKSKQRITSDEPEASFSRMYNAYHISDGAAMRAAPIGIVAGGDIAKAAAWAEADASVSHFRDGIWGAQAVAAGVSRAMAGGRWMDHRRRPECNPRIRGWLTHSRKRWPS